MTHFSIQLLDSALHRREDFDCGVDALNRYLREKAGQDMRRMASGCWVLVDLAEPAAILGYYTLSPEGIEARELPELSSALRKKMPTYQRLGAVLLGRLAVHQDHQSKKLGERLLFDAFHRSLRSEIPSVLMVTDPKDDKAEAFYAKYGFQRLNPQRLFLTLVSISQVLGTRD